MSRSNKKRTNKKQNKSAKKYQKKQRKNWGGEVKKVFDANDNPISTCVDPTKSIFEAPLERQFGLRKNCDQIETPLYVEGNKPIDETAIEEETVEEEPIQEEGEPNEEKPPAATDAEPTNDNTEFPIPPSNNPPYPRQPYQGGKRSRRHRRKSKKSMKTKRRKRKN